MTPSRIADQSVDQALDLEIRQLLQACFPKEAKFKTQRHYNQPPAMRWLLRNEDKPIGHIAAHQKSFRSGSATYRFCGISEVCILPDYRGKGQLAPLLQALEDYYIGQSYDFLILLGAAKVYEQFGYQIARNVYFPSQSSAPSEFAMYKVIGDSSWLETSVEIDGPYF